MMMMMMIMMIMMMMMIVNFVIKYQYYFVGISNTSVTNLRFDKEPRDQNKLHDAFTVPSPI